MKSTALALGVFLTTALAVPQSTPNPVESTPTPTVPAWAAFKKAASSLFVIPPERTDVPEKRSTDNVDVEELIRCPSGNCPNPQANSPPHLFGVGNKASRSRKPIDNAAEKGCMPLIQLTIPWYRTFVLYNCECGDECPEVKRGCRLDALLEVFTGNTALLYTCPPQCVHGAMSLNAAAAIQKRDLDGEEEDMCYSIMNDGVNNASATPREPTPPSERPSYDSTPAQFAADMHRPAPVCLGFTNKLYKECVKRCDESSLETDDDVCQVDLENVYNKMVKKLPSYMKKPKTSHVNMHLNGGPLIDDSANRPDWYNDAENEFASKWKSVSKTMKKDLEDFEMRGGVGGRRPHVHHHVETHVVDSSAHDSRVPGWCSAVPLPIEDDGYLGDCANIVREFCRTHDCYDG